MNKIKDSGREVKKAMDRILIRSTAPNPDFYIGVKSAAQY